MIDQDISLTFTNGLKENKFSDQRRFVRLDNKRIRLWFFRRRSRQATSIVVTACGLAATDHSQSTQPTMPFGYYGISKDTSVPASDNNHPVGHSSELMCLLGVRIRGACQNPSISISKTGNHAF